MHALLNMNSTAKLRLLLSQDSVATTLMRGGQHYRHLRQVSF